MLRSRRLGTALAAAAALVAAPVCLSAQTVRISTAVAGQPPTAVQANTLYSLSKSGNACPYRLVASLSAAMPAGVTLTANAPAPAAGATSLGAVVLSTAPATLATGLPCQTTISNKSITYALTATSAAGVVATATRSVTLQVTP